MKLIKETCFSETQSFMKIVAPATWNSEFQKH